MILFLTALLAAAAPAAAHADDGKIGPATIPGETQEEKMRWIRAELKKADTNGDRQLTAAEWVAAGGKREKFDLLDTNKDGILQIRELRSNAKLLRAFEDFQAAAPH
jgi:hypothetical protein